MRVDRNGLQVLTRPQCFELLGMVQVGRIAFTVDALPAVLPVNFALWSGRIVFRTGAGSKLAAATRHAVVAFEADDSNDVDGSGWSVMAVGVAREVTDAAQLADIERLGIPQWVGDGGRHYVALHPERLTGRRLVRPLGAELTT